MSEISKLDQNLIIKKIDNETLNLQINEKFGINKKKILSFPFNLFSLNIFASHAVFVVSKKN